MSAVDELVAAFTRDYPAAVARLVETAEPAELAELLSTLPAHVAASLVARTAPVTAAQGLESMRPAAAAAVIEALDPRTAAALLRRSKPENAERLVSEVSDRAGARLRRLMRYTPDQAAGHADPRAPAVTRHTTVEQALDIVRGAADGALNYVYVVDDGHRLVGVASMRELMLAEPRDLVSNVMVEDPYSIAASDPLEAVVRHPGWRKAHALPVVDDTRRFLGVIRYSEFRALETELGLAGAAPSAGNTAATLAELFWLGTSAIARLGEAAVLGRTREPGEADR